MGSAQHRERRQWRRGNSRLKDLTVQVGDAPGMPAAVLNESLTGISLGMTDASMLEMGQEVRLCRGARAVPAIVRHVLARPDTGDYQVGMEWGACEVKPASLLLLLPTAD